MKIFSDLQLHQADLKTIENLNISSTNLMEFASTQCFNWLHEKLQGTQVPIYIFCGIGNNGGDGLVIARLLHIHGYQVKVLVANFTDKRSPDFLVNYNLFKEVSKEWPTLMTSEKDFPSINPKDIIIDALFGIGLNRPPEGWVKKLVQHLNHSEAFILSIDMPSGLYANKAIEDEESIIQSDHVLTFQSPKIAFFLPQSEAFVPSFSVLDIGLDAAFLNSQEPLAVLLNKEVAQQMYKPRNKFDHKGTYGYGLLVGGSYGKMGAMVLASKALLKVGGGTVTSFVPKAGYNILQTAIPEAMVITGSDHNIIKDIRVNFSPSAIGIGMGMGTHEDSIAALKFFFKKSQEYSLVIDADALNCIAMDNDLLKLIPKHSILTPHPGELKRLIGEWKDDYHKIELVKEFSKKHEIIVLVKGAHSMIVFKDDVLINTTGNPGMATAGSGDVLSGMITGLLSQDYKPLDAVVFAVYLHGKAGDMAAMRFGFEALIASNIIDGISVAYQDLFQEEEIDENPPK